MKYRCIGAGFCGTVWALPEDHLAFKREDGGPDRSLANDYTMHQRVYDSFSQLSDFKNQESNTSQMKISPQVQIPKCHRFMTPSDPWWMANLSLFPSQYSPCNVIVSERIPAFSEMTRELLVERYCSPKIETEILKSSTNKDCLIRPYLGRRRTQRTEIHRPSRFAVFSLRNYPLHEDQMEDIGISTQDMQRYARMMGEALATLHWLGEVDGNDIEFVLAPPPSCEGYGTEMIVNALGEHTMWMLDFDLCRSMSMDQAGVEQAVTAFWRNDPFYPRPQSKLWNEYREQYLRTSEWVIRCSDTDAGERLYLARRFVELIEKDKIIVDGI